MSDICPVVTILRDGVEVRINASEYDPKVHKLAGVGSTPVTEDKSVQDMTATELREYAKANDIDVKGLKSREQLLAAVTGEGVEELIIMPTADGKFQIIDSNGESVDGEVYETQEDAEKALLGE